MSLIIRFDPALFSRHDDDLVGKITQSVYHYDKDSKRSHAAEPIKRMEDIWGISDMLVKKRRWRDNMLFLLGINFGWRCGDLMSLRIGDVLAPDGTIRHDITLEEAKTGKWRTVTNNETTATAIVQYLQTKPEINLDDFLFTSESNNKTCLGIGQPLDRRSVDRILKQRINREYGLAVHASTHCLRKTFAYHTLITAKDRSRALELVQKLLNHSSPAITLMYAGITEDELRSVYESDIFARRPMDFQTTSGMRKLG